MPLSVRLMKLSLTNYRGVGSLDLDFKGKSGQIEGRNGAGKTSAIEAVEWLVSDCLLGDRHDLSSVKPLSETSKKVVAEGVFLVGADELRIKKEYYEVWVRHKGDDQPTMEGHCTDYWVNGAKMNLKNYQKAIEERFGFAQKPGDVDWFQTATDPFYFAQTLCGGADWKDARKSIIDMVGDVTNDEVFKKCPGAELARKDLEAHKYVSKDGAVSYDDGEAKKAIKSEIDGSKAAIIGKQAVIDEFDKALAEPLDEAQTAFAQSKIDEAEEAVAKLNSGDASAYDRQIDDAQQALIGLQKRYQDSMKAPEADRTKSDALAKEIKAKNGALWDAKSALSSAKFRAETLSTQIGICQGKRQGFIDRINGVNKRLAEYKPDDTCPTCHQPLPREMVEKAKKEYLANVEEDGKRALEEGKANKALLDGYQKELASLNLGGLQTAVDVAAKQADDARKAYDEAFAKESAAVAQPKADPAIKGEIDRLTAEIAGLREKKRTANDGVAQKIADIRDSEAPYKATVQAANDRARDAKRRDQAKADMQAEMRKQADAEARYAAVNLFVKTKLELLDEHIAKVFGKIRFQLVRPNIRQGSYDEVCSPYIYDIAKGESTDVLFANGSKSEQVRTGCAIAKAIADHFGHASLPIVFDQGGEMDEASLSMLYEFMGVGQQIVSVKVCDDFRTPTFVEA